MGALKHRGLGMMLLGPRWGRRFQVATCQHAAWAPIPWLA
jgi:hypothetical protein